MRFNLLEKIHLPIGQFTKFEVQKTGSELNTLVDKIPYSAWDKKSVPAGSACVLALCLASDHSASSS